jgi:hypothetical protein
MCNSYSNGLCLYYGVSIKEMNNKCDRGDCMTKDELIELLDKVKSYPPEYIEISVKEYLLKYINDIDISRAASKVPRVYK